MRKLLLSILANIIVYAYAYAQDGLFSHDDQFPFIVITSDTVQSLPAFTDDDFYAQSEGVVFKVNRSEISKDDPFMVKYRNEVLPYINGSHLQFRKVFIRGAASPEGPYANNQRLGRARSAALMEELKKGLAFQYVEADAETSSVAEDYGYLCLLMKEAGDADYDKVRRIYESCKGDELCCKENLQRADHGKLWARLLKEYFPRLRSARIILWFSLPDAKHAPMPQLDFISNKIDERVEAKLPPMGEIAPITWEEAPATRRHLVAVRTNLVHDLFYMPNIGFVPSANVQLEYYPKDGHYTWNLGFTWSNHRHRKDHDYFQVRDFQIEARRYFKGHGEFLGTYIGAFAQGDVYGLGLDAKKGWEGAGAGAGLTLGHVMPLNKKKSLRLELMAAAGYYLTRFDPYVYGNPVTGEEDGKYYYKYFGSASDFKKRNHQLTWMGPLNVGVQLTYDIIYRKKHK